LIGQITVEGWKTHSSQRIQEYIESNEESIESHCKKDIPFIDPLGSISLELGIAGHIEVSRHIWRKRNGPINGHNDNVIKIKLIYCLMQDNKLKDAIKLLKDLHSEYLRAEALAIIAAFYSRTNLRGAKVLYKKAYKELIPEENQLELRNKNGNYDEAIFFLAGSVARWNIGEANRIINNFIKKEEYHKRARAEILFMLSVTDPDRAYSNLIDLIDEGAKNGLAEFWISLSLCSEALCRMIQLEDVKSLLSKIMVLEKYR